MVLTEMTRALPAEVLARAIDETVLGRLATRGGLRRPRGVPLLGPRATHHRRGDPGGRWPVHLAGRGPAAGVAWASSASGTRSFGRRTDATVQELAFEAFAVGAGRRRASPRDAIEASVIAAVPEYHTQRSIAGAVQRLPGAHPAADPAHRGRVRLGQAPPCAGLAGDPGRRARRRRRDRLPEDDRAADRRRSCRSWAASATCSGSRASAPPFPATTRCSPAGTCTSTAPRASTCSTSRSRTTTTAR